MIGKLIAWSVNNRMIVLLMAVLAVAGTWAQEKGRRTLSCLIRAMEALFGKQIRSYSMKTEH